MPHWTMKPAALLSMVAAAAACAAISAQWQPEFRAGRETAPPDAAIVRAWAGQFAAASFTGRSGTVLPYRILRGRSGGRLPLVVVLHGSGAMGSDNRGQLGPFAASWAQLAGDAVVVVPQVATRSADYRDGADGLIESAPGPSLGLLLELIDFVAGEAGVDRQRIHLVGFSMGASAALQAALARPAMFASVDAFAPVPPPRARATELIRPALTVIHGDADVENPFAADAAWIDVLRRAGARPRFIVYRGMDHRVPGDMLVASDWRRALITRVPTPAVSQ